MLVGLLVMRKCPCLGHKCERKLAGAERCVVRGRWMPVMIMRWRKEIKAVMRADQGVIFG